MPTVPPLFQPYCVHCDDGVRLLFFAESAADAEVQAEYFMDRANFDPLVCIERTELLVAVS